MESIDRLRKYVECHDKITGLTATCINHLIDSIEEEVEGMRDFCERLDDAATKREDVTLWGVDYMPCPLDADGEPIHVGDVMENIVCPSVHREVTGVGVECFYGWDEGNGRYSQFGANCYRHHHTPTVEDVLEELLREYDRDDSELTNGEIIERFAAKLQLKER